MSHPGGSEKLPVLLSENSVSVPQMLQHGLELGAPPEPKCDPSQSVLAWPLRQRPSPDEAGCVVFREENSSKDFWTSTDLPR